MSFTGQWRRYGCCPLDQDDLPSPPQNLVVFEMIGYNYRSIPEWFDETGQKMLPIQFSVLHNNLLYRYTFYKRDDPLCDHVFHLSTSDGIFPLIYEKLSGKRMKVQKVNYHNGYTTWRVTC